MATRSPARLAWALSVVVLLGCNGSRAPSGATACGPDSPPAPRTAPEPPEPGPSLASAPATDAAPPGLDAAITSVSTDRRAHEPCPAGWRCDPSLLQRTDRPRVSSVLIEKSAHRLHLAIGDTVVKSYSVALGWGGPGPKQYEGDGKTPVGTYRITGRLPTSPWHLFLAVSYPNLEDQRRYGRLKAQGAVPIGAGVGFGIGIHGRAAAMRDGEHKREDWTLGCIALDNPEVEEVAALVPNGAAVVITD